MSSTRGFTLIELLLVVLVLSILVMIAVPAMRTMLANAQLRGTADEMRGGIELARAEAIRRNADVQFVLNDTGWSVVAPGGGPKGEDQTLSSRAPRKGMAQVAGDAKEIAFSSSGWTTPFGSSLTLSFSAPDAGKCKPDGPIACLTVSVASGGMVRACDPSAAKGAATACN